MTIRTLSAFLFFAFGTLMFGQTDSNSLTVSITRSMTLQPDQVVFTVSVVSPLTATLDDVVQALAGSGLTSADLSTVRSAQLPASDNSQNCVPGLQWTFALAVPFSKMK